MFTWPLGLTVLGRKLISEHALGRTNYNPTHYTAVQMVYLGSVAVLTYMSRRSQRRRATICNDPFADLSEDSRRRRQRFHDQQSRERDEFAWFLEATFGWQSPERMAVKCKGD